MDSSSHPAPPHLQTAQVLADLNALKQTPPQVALSFLRTLSTIPTTQHERKTSIYSQPPQKFDRLGRRISTTQRPSRGSGSSSEAPSPPPMLRAHSSMTSPDLPETEESKRISRELRHLRRQSDGQDSEFRRAKTLLSYYRNRDRLQEKCIKGIKLSQERVDRALTEQAERRLKKGKTFEFGLTPKGPGESQTGSYF
ncbi:hypothetical protein MFRU_014g00180 [Monilinia fructicola]|uniref:Uncharacterized protein n=1 Tax=Monilinia fructicola TaxID=38448 RepID=A0A5M9K5K9_MONFR|nr:hypothetical protein EYC84_006957 [Monilinia fructicola]KAG4029713.1 hypothetical protein MFRU_014g00180 [Monilinia fructicola]